MIALVGRGLTCLAALLLQAKTAAAEACLRDPGAIYGYTAVVGGSPSGLAEEGARQRSPRAVPQVERLRFLATSAAASLHDSHLSLITFSAGPHVSVAELCECRDCLLSHFLSAWGGADAMSSPTTIAPSPWAGPRPG